MEIELTPVFREAFPEGIFGVLIVQDCSNRARALAIGPAQRVVETRLRERFPDDTIDSDPVALAYAVYFRRYGARYPVVHQARTIIVGRAIDSPFALVEVMFTAEVDGLVLTSGHDLDALAGPLRVDVARAGDAYTKLSGKEQALKPGDMVVRDAEGIIACVLYGPDFRTRLRPETHAALFGAWCPAGLSAAVAEAPLTPLAGLLRQEWPEPSNGSPRVARRRFPCPEMRIK